MQGQTSIGGECLQLHVTGGRIRKAGEKAGRLVDLVIGRQGSSQLKLYMLKEAQGEV